MIGYVTLGTNDLGRSAAFYDAVLAEIGAGRWKETQRSVVWRAVPGHPSLCLIQPYDGAAASVGNGVMVALYAGTPEKVRALHARALAMGGKNEGDAGPRDSSPGFYAAYFRDLDGNKLNVFCVDMSSTS